ncbi:hypothetical protein Tco_0717985 [Tanacetum coccineum]
MLISGIRAQGIKQHSNSRFNHHSRKSALDKKQRMKKLIDDVYMVLEIRMKDICNIILDIRIQQIEMKTANNKLHTMEQIQEDVKLEKKNQNSQEDESAKDRTQEGYHKQGYKSILKNPTKM